jgi:hypothetical protein
MVGDQVTMEPVEMVDHHGDTIVGSRYDGPTTRPTPADELIMSDYFSMREGRIVSLAIIRSQPSPY